MQEYRKKFFTRASAASLLLVVVLLTTTISLAAPNKSYTPKTLTSLSKISTSTDIITSVCNATTYPTVCQSTWKSAAKTPPKSVKDVFDLSVQRAMDHCHFCRNMAYNMTQAHRRIQLGKPSAVDDCLELLDNSLYHLTNCVNRNDKSDVDDIDTWLSAALTNPEVCTDGLHETGMDKSAAPMKLQVQKLKQFISNALELHQKVKSETEKGKKPKNPPEDSRYPAWMKVADWKLLEASPEEVKVDAVVALDGSGTHRTIGEAVAFVTSLASSSNGGSVIYIKPGTYYEYINLPTQQNVMLMGAGKGVSVIVGSRSVANGYTTYNSATVAAMGAGFIAKGLTIINNSGPQKGQAVALRLGSDKSVVYQCSIQGYQDTLYAFSNRQFYRNTDIYGSVDFIFGNAAAVIQNCNIQPRRPITGQEDTITAQSRISPYQNTGFSIHACRVVGGSDLGGTPTYLGRPWKQYSRVVYLESYLDGSINHAGWLEWSGNFALSTLFYGEYGNSGPGAGTSGRVRWPGVHPSLSAAQASQFTVSNFIFGNSWLPGTGVAYTAGL